MWKQSKLQVVMNPCLARESDLSGLRFSLGTMEITTSSEEEKHLPQRSAEGTHRKGQELTSESDQQPQTMSSSSSKRKAGHNEKGKAKKHGTKHKVHRSSQIQALGREEKPSCQTCTSDSGSEECKRILSARRTVQNDKCWKSAAKEFVGEEAPGHHAPSVDMATSDSEMEWDEPHATSASGGIPASSGIFDYTAWLMEAQLDEDQRQRLHERVWTYMDFCAGFGTSTVVAEAVRRASQRHALNCEGHCVAITEADPKKRAHLHHVLARGCEYNRTSQPMPKPVIFAANADAGIATLPVDEAKVAVQLPAPEVCFFGIVCVSISSQTQTPKSLEDLTGSSGVAWAGFLGYLQRLPLQSRPRCLILECVANLKNRRHVDKKTTTGCQQVVEALEEAGYKGDWRTVNTLDFGLPQSRPRVYGVFIHVGWGCGPQSFHKAFATANHILERVVRFQCKTVGDLHTALKNAYHKQVGVDVSSTRLVKRRIKPRGLRTSKRQQAFPRDLKSSVLAFCFHAQAEDTSSCSFFRLITASPNNSQTMVSLGLLQSTIYPRRNCSMAKRSS